MAKYEFAPLTDRLIAAQIPCDSVTPGLRPCAGPSVARAVCSACPGIRPSIWLCERCRSDLIARISRGDARCRRCGDEISSYSGVEA